MTALLSEKPGYVYDNVAVYDLTIKIAVYDEKGKIIDRVDPTEQDFPIKVELTYDQLQFPEGITGTTHDFAVSHMFAQEIGGHTPGETEEPTVEKTDKGLSFYVNGTSPLAVAWKTADSNNPDNPDDPDDPNNPDNPDDPNNPDNPDDPNNPDNPDDPNNPDNRIRMQTETAQAIRTGTALTETERHLPPMQPNKVHRMTARALFPTSCRRPVTQFRSSRGLRRRS